MWFHRLWSLGCNWGEEDLFNSDVLGKENKYILESGTFKYILPSNTTYFRYIDDILLFLPQNIKIEEIAEKLSNIEPTNNFTYEKESNNTSLNLS